MSEQLDILKKVCEKLNSANVPYMVSGSLAMNFYAQPRMTRDIDIVIMLAKADVPRFIVLFENEFYIEAETVHDEVARKGMFNLIHNETIIKIDFIVDKGGEYDVTAFGRRKEIDVDGISVWMISPEDLIIRKLLWSKESMSEMQTRDVDNMLSMCDDLDGDYLRSWITKLGLQGQYDKVSK